jgi:PAS domain S-box-containing protein
MTLISKNNHAVAGAEEILIHNNHLSQTSIKDSSDIMIFINAEGIVTYVSPAIITCTGYTPAEMIDRRVFAFIHPDDVDVWQEILAGVGQIPGKGLSAEFRLLCRNGGWRWCEGSVTNLLDVSAVGAIIGSFRDITRQKQASYPDWCEINTSDHLVQFYETDTFLLGAMNEFIGTGLSNGNPCVVIATREHLDSLEEQLKVRGMDLVAARTRDEYFALDAAETLSKFMVDGMPEQKRFMKVIGDIIARAAKGSRHVCAFGEMVALLWMEGNSAGAIKLEEFWNNLQSTTPCFSLLCAYPMHCFAGKVYEQQFSRICQHHSQVIPDESYTALSSTDERLRAITLLQQKANSFDAEVEERRATEATLLHLAAIVESSDDAILSKDLDGVITSWNAAAERMFGYSAREIVGQPVSIIFPLDRKDEFTQIMERIRRGDRVDHYETKRVRKDGTVLTVSVTVSPVKDRSGRIIGASDITRDITAQRQLEAKFRQLFDSKLIGVFVSELSGTFLDANDALLDLLGYTRAELLRGEMQRDTLTPPEFSFLSQRVVQELYETGSSGPYEKEYLHKSGRRIPVLIAVARIEQTDTSIGFVLDISERKELDKRKDEFISMASHELKTPVTSLKGFLSILQRHLVVQKEEKLLHYITRMDAQVNKLTKLINDLLDLSKMQRGQLAYREEYFDMDALVQEVVENVQETTQTHHLVLDGQSQARVFGDRDRVGQVLINLLNNAIKYSPHANTVLVHVAKEQDKAIVSIQDFGIGIAQEYQQKIFERFFQVVGAEGKTYPGLGMGLYISSEIVKRHNGQMWVESEKGKGAKFSFSLPLA